MLAGIFCDLGPLARAAEVETPIVAVEGQPLAANVRRLIEALVFLGAPLDGQTVDELMAACQARDGRELQRLLDPHALCIVSINPESRVKVQRGPGRRALQQAGFTPVIVKVINLSSVTKPLRVSSPQAGPVYAGVEELSMQRQEQLALRENENTTGDLDRFLEVAVYENPPMTDRLSGLAVEYAIVMLFSSEAGAREATLQFDVGQGTQDIGFRGELPILFDVQPATPVLLSIRDHDGQPTTARLVFRDAAGNVYPPQPKRLAPDLFFQPQIYRQHGETVRLPTAGGVAFELTSSRGPEYRVLSQRVVMDELPRDASRNIPMLSIQLQRWVNPAEFGFYSGDHHIHGAGCAHYTSPAEGVTPADMFRQVKGEGLNVGCVLTWGPCFDYQRNFFHSQVDGVSEPETVLKYDLEISGFGSQALGHVCLLNLTDQTYPGSEGTATRGWPTWTLPVMQWAKAQNAVTGYAHSASGLEIQPVPAAKRMLTLFDTNHDARLQPNEAASSLLPEPFATIDGDRDQQLSESELSASHDRVADQLPNLAIPEMDGVGAMEIAVTTALGACDFISAMDTQRIQEWNMWYHLLNCGFPLKVSGETDFPCMSGTRVGQGRVYVQLGAIDRLDFAAWCDGLRRGRSYVSDGYAHALQFTVGGQSPGFDDVSLDGPGEVAVEAEVAFSPEMPQSVAHGERVDGVPRRLWGDTVLRHDSEPDRLGRTTTHRVEVILNGRPIAHADVPADGAVHRLQFRVPIQRSGWIALRHFPQLHTNPVNVLVAGAPIRASRNSALWCRATIEQLWRSRSGVIADSERQAAREAYDRAIRVFDAIAAESPTDDS